MNYSHSYHAGNFADVFKHIVLLALVKSFLRKDNGFCYLDTHAGSGFYDLSAESSQKTKEYELGISKLFHKEHPPQLIKQYIGCVRQMNNRLTQSMISNLRYYPGSPALVHYFLRPQDRMILTELHPQEAQTLKRAYSNDQRVSVHVNNGYQSLKAFLPPKERRGLILIDPPYERPHESIEILQALPLALKRFATGTYAIWYPIKNRAYIDQLHRATQEVVKQPILVTELSIYEEVSPLHLNGSGLLIVNPPWELDRQIQDFLPWLWKNLSIQGKGQYRNSMLGEK
jgi:23S rRNA (adenine2030-N6)-methyltransferase